jgi:hypothetical protein
MIGKLVWVKSGDEIKFSPTSPDLLTYYVETLNATDSNSFSLSASKFSSDTVSKLTHCIQTISNKSNKIPFEIDNWTGDVLDQDYLNLLHRQWVLTGIKYPMIPVLLRKLGNLDSEFRDINTLLHVVETSFRYTFKNYTQDPYQIDNVFGTDVLGFDTPNISIGHDNLGRSSWEKFRNFDNNADDQDTNDYKKLTGLIHFRLGRPISGTAPPEYLAWCKEHGVAVAGHTLSLGNVIDLESNLTDLRKIVVRNVNEQNDKFFFEVCAN